jgi:hypothetical protein
MGEMRVLYRFFLGVGNLMEREPLEDPDVAASIILI